ncbi:unnamed protein product [Kuraishia capsulata CBS 1993]|uniref:Uncharacterized protein n=1 Tax=Kuraishia capsulata CBS 1993 TaxID=1382522 RepID=W6MU40_9ASCO|nr:uncharacterized protein KUCA_T00004842001 [Kuraishia capsulata CBS 1993]CDK28857.1 unnamed protein product [Kuraishia capsulata CBS 1993]
MTHSDVVPKQEEAVYAELVEVRQHLSKIKRDHSKFLNSKDIQLLYDQVFVELKQIREIRANEPAEAFPNKVDILVDECFQLISLCFVTVGLAKTAPATYASLSTVQRLLEHLHEGGVYTHHDLQPIDERLSEIRAIIDQAENSSQETTVLEAKLKTCVEEYENLKKELENLPSDLEAVINRLLTIRRTLINLITRPDQFSMKDLELLKTDLHSLENSKDKDGISLLDLDVGVLKNGQGVLKGLIDDCHDMINDLQFGSERVDSGLAPLYNNLISIKNQLENLLVTRRWTLRSTDLFNYERTLQGIDNQRVNGKFVSEKDGSTPTKGQSILLYLLRRCYAIIYKLLESSEPVSEALQPIHNQLSTVRRCLFDVKRMGGISSIRELYPYQLKLASLDNLRQDGKFMVDGQIPEGQGTLTALLAECFDICHEMKLEFEEGREGEEESVDNHKDGFSGTKSGWSEQRYDDDDEDEEEEEEQASKATNKFKDLSLAGDDDEDEDTPSYAASYNESEVPTDIDN